MPPEATARIPPSILAADFGRSGEAIRAVHAGGADWTHVAVMARPFLPTIPFRSPAVVAAGAATRRPRDVHVMSEPVEPHLDDFVAAGADAITVDVEAVADPAATLRRIRELGVRAGLTLRPGTPESLLWPYLDALDIVLVMSVEPGAGGQAFIPEMLERIASLATRIESQSTKVDLVVDGGINAETAPSVVQAGGNVLVAGTSVFGHGDGPAAGVRALRRALG